MRRLIATAWVTAVVHCGAVQAEEVGSFSNDWIGNGIVIEAIADPKVQGVTCHMSHFDRSIIDRLRAILANQLLLLQIVVDELRAVQTRFGDARRTEIIDQEGEFSIEDLIADEDVAVTVTDTGYIKRTPITTYRR